MIVVDTSVWVVAFRSAAGAAAHALRALLDSDEVALAAPVRIELLVGAGRTDRARLRRVLSALPLLVPARSTWHLIDTWIDRAGDAGERFGFADLLIGALASERNAEIWSLDTDFERMERLSLLKLHRPS